MTQDQHCPPNIVIPTMNERSPPFAGLLPTSMPNTVRQRQSAQPRPSKACCGRRYGKGRQPGEDNSLDTYFHSWPGIDGKAAQYLAARHVRLVGCDCASIDASGSEDFPAHRALLSAGVLIGENFNNLGEVGSIATFVSLPLPIVDGTGSPLRAVAILSPPSQK